jgi:ABC-type multidrug transport system ATPase subunit
MQRPIPPPPGAEPPPVEVVRLRKVYRDVAAVDGLDFKLAAGAVTALLGGNGAGKTTTIAMLMGLVIPTSGQARVFGADMARERYRVLYRMNFESPYVDVPMRLTVRQNLEVYGRLYRRASSQVASGRRLPQIFAQRVSRPSLRQAVGGAEDARQVLQGRC